MAKSTIKGLKKLRSNPGSELKKCPKCGHSRYGTCGCDK
jgi:hypothetical protein